MFLRDFDEDSAHPITATIRELKCHVSSLRQNLVKI